MHGWYEGKGHLLNLHHSQALIAAQESIEGVVDLKHEDPNHIHAFLSCLYNFDYAADDSSTQLEMDISMHRLGEYYDVQLSRS